MTDEQRRREPVDIPGGKSIRDFKVPPSLLAAAGAELRERMVAPEGVSGPNHWHVTQALRDAGCPNCADSFASFSTVAFNAIAATFRAVSGPEPSPAERELASYKFMVAAVHRVCDEHGIPKPPENEPGIPWRVLWLLRERAVLLGSGPEPAERICANCGHDDGDHCRGVCEAPCTCKQFVRRADA